MELIVLIFREDNVIGKSNGPWDVETKGHFETPMIFLGILMCLPLMFTTSFYRYYGLCAVNFFVSLFFFSGLLLFFSKKNYFRIVIVSFLMMMGFIFFAFLFFLVLGYSRWGNASIFNNAIFFVPLQILVALVTKNVLFFCFWLLVLSLLASCLSSKYFGKACLWRNFYKILIIYGVLGFTLISRLYNENAYSYEKLFIVIGIFVVFSLRYKERKFSLDIVKALLGIFLLNIFWAAIYLWLADSDKYLQFIIL